MIRTTKGNWDYVIRDLEEFFKSPDLPEQAQLNPSVRIIDLKLFAESHLQIVKSKNGRLGYRPYLDRLLEVKKILSNHATKNTH
jgi:hypothetical protein